MHGSIKDEDLYNGGGKYTFTPPTGRRAPEGQETYRRRLIRGTNRALRPVGRVAFSAIVPKLKSRPEDSSSFGVGSQCPKRNRPSQCISWGLLGTRLRDKVAAHGETSDLRNNVSLPASRQLFGHSPRFQFLQRFFLMLSHRLPRKISLCRFL